MPLFGFGKKSGKAKTLKPLADAPQAKVCDLSNEEAAKANLMELFEKGSKKTSHAVPTAGMRPAPSLALAANTMPLLHRLPLLPSLI